MRALAPGHTVHSRYQILALAGRGGMGAVYAARDGSLGTTVAIKQTLAGDEVLRRAFRREARLLAALRHPALPQVLDHFEESGELFLVMEYVPGDDLGALLSRRRAPFPVGDVLAWADVLLGALEYLHSQAPPVVHRDIKPQNLKLTPGGQIVLLDFGLARGAAAGQTLMLSGATLAGYTPHYAPVEQIQGGATDARADLYGLGATLYHLLAGEAPPDALARAVARLNEDPDPLPHLCDARPELPRALGDAVMAALALRAAERPASASALRAALRAAADAATAEAPVATTQTAPLPIRPGRRLWAASLLALAIAVGAGAVAAARPAATAAPTPTAVVLTPSPVTRSSPDAATAVPPTPSAMPASPAAQRRPTLDAFATAEAAASPTSMPTATVTPTPSPSLAPPSPTAAPRPIVRPRPTAAPTAAPPPVPIIPGP